MRFHSEWVKSKKGGSARIRYWKDGKNNVLPKSEYPTFINKEDAKKWCEQQNAKMEQCRLISRHESLIDIDLKKEMIGDWTTVINEFILWHQTTAKHTHESARTWLKIYVIPFFLEKKAKYHLWPEHYKDFRKHLLVVKSEKTGKLLSYSSRNHIIKYLNLFLAFVKEEKKLIGPFDKCKYFAKDLLNQRGVESLISNEEIESIKRHLDDPSLEFLYVLLNSGLRLNELKSLQLTGVEINLSNLKPLILKPFYTLGKTIFGYIRLESQIENSEKRNYRNEIGCITRKPLKCRKKISPENHRIIPITDELTWGILLKYRRLALADLRNRKFISNDPNDYLLFNLPLQDITKGISKFFKKSKSAHCARHSYCTTIVSEFLECNIGPEYVRFLLGHSEREWRRYTHIVLDKQSEDRKKDIQDF